MLFFYLIVECTYIVLGAKSLRIRPITGCFWLDQAPSPVVMANLRSQFLPLSIDVHGLLYVTITDIAVPKQEIELAFI